MRLFAFRPVAEFKMESARAITLELEATEEGGCWPTVAIRNFRSDEPREVAAVLKLVDRIRLELEAHLAELPDTQRMRERQKREEASGSGDAEAEGSGTEAEGQRIESEEESPSLSAAPDVGKRKPRGRPKGSRNKPRPVDNQVTMPTGVTETALEGNRDTEPPPRVEPELPPPEPPDPSLAVLVAIADAGGTIDGRTLADQAALEAARGRGWIRALPSAIGVPLLRITDAGWTTLEREEVFGPAARRRVATWPGRWTTLEREEVFGRGVEP
jgi:hypothetical protein